MASDWKGRVSVEEDDSFANITDAKNAGKLMSAADLIPIPPMLIGNVAWVHIFSSKDKFSIFSTVVLMILSYSAKRSPQIQDGIVLRRYVSFGMEKQFFRRKRAE
jgi:hypothetical protein